MSMTDGEAAVKNLTDKRPMNACKGCHRVKNDIAALTDRSPTRSTALPARPPNRPAAATAGPAPMPNRPSTTCRSAAAP